MDCDQSLRHRWLQSASQLYDNLTLKNTNDLYNAKAPEPWVAFMLGGIFSGIGVVMWMHRLNTVRVKRPDIPFQGSYLVRAMISTAIDADEPFYTIASFSGISFLFLGALQWHYQISFSVMLATFGITSFGDSLRVILAFREAKTIADAGVSSNIMESSLRTAKETELKPANVYEDLGRGRTIIILVFITQTILISFVIADVFSTETYKCPDGTPDCPTLGTLGSWGLYVLGIFMACVYILGPKTSFGQSEQNPAFWLQLLLIAKKVGAKCTWYDPMSDETKERYLKSNDIHIWSRFFMSYLINGVGFHVLVHALPIQVAYQTTLTGVVIRAVGMIYLVDLDDTSGHTLKLVEEKKPDKNVKPAEDPAPPCSPEPILPATPASKTDIPIENDADDLSEEAKRIVDEAMAKLQALARGDARNPETSMKQIAGSLLFLSTASRKNLSNETSMQSQMSQNPIDDTDTAIFKRGNDIEGGTCGSRTESPGVEGDRTDGSKALGKLEEM